MRLLHGQHANVVDVLLGQRPDLSARYGRHRDSRASQGPVFEPLHDRTYFAGFQIHPEFRTLSWPNGADIAPDFLHEKVRLLQP